MEGRTVATKPIHEQLAGSDPLSREFDDGAAGDVVGSKHLTPLGNEETWCATISKVCGAQLSPDDPCWQYLQTQGVHQGDDDLIPDTAAKYAPLEGKRWYVSLSVSGLRGEFLIDTGASHTLVGREFLSRSGILSDVPKAGIKARTATGDVMQTYGRTVKTMLVDGKAYMICPTIADITDDGILGMDFAALYGMQMNARTGVLQIQNPYKQTVKCVLRVESTPASIVQTTNLEPGQISNVLISSVGVQRNRRSVFEPSSDTLGVLGIESYNTFVENACWTVVPMCNPTTQRVVMEKGLIVGTTSITKSQELISENGEETVTGGKHLPVVESVRDDELPPHLMTLIDESDLRGVDKERAIKELSCYRDAFSSPGQPLGRTEVVQHSIDTGDTRPVKLPYRRLPLGKKSALEEEVDKMLNEGIISPSESPWSSPVVMVTKKDGTCRFCIDYRKLNGITRKNAYPLPRIDECLESLGGAKWFCTLDLQSGYWQIGMNPEDKEKTAFATHMGLYEFNVMSFGLCNAPATFEAMMETMLRGLLWKKCLVYLDDIIVYGSTFKQCSKNLSEVLRKLESYGLKLKPTKCKLFRQSVEYLGRIVSGDGIKADPSKVLVVENWPLPTNLKEIRSFIGFCSYYRDFIPGFSYVATPLQALIVGDKKSKAKLDLSLEARNAFLELKRLFRETPVLHYPSPVGQFILDTDASNESIGAALSQVQNGKEVPLAFASNSLSKSQRNYCTTKRELLAVVVYTRKYRHFLYGGDFVLRTDHSALQWLLNFKDAEGMMGRWLNHLSEFGVENRHIEHRSGIKHINADCLSRIPIRLCHRVDCNDCGVHNAVIASISVKTPNWSLEVMKEQQEKDIAISRLYNWKLFNHSRPVRPALSLECKEVRTLVAQWDDLFIQDGVLCRWRYRPGRRKMIQMVVPEALRLEILHFCHGHKTSAHFGRERTELKIKGRYYWPGMTKDIRRWVKHCPQCCLANPGPGLGKLPLSQEIFGVRFARIAVDIISGFNTTPRGNTCMMVVTDYYTKYVQIYPLPNHTAATCATALFENWVLIWGAPLKLHSDQGPEFESRLWGELCSRIYTCRTHTNPYRPQSDGQVERFNRTLVKCLTTMVNDHRDDWDEMSRYVAHAYNATESASTGCTPNMLVLGEEIIMPVDMVYGVPGVTREQPCTVMFVEALRHTLRESYALARSYLEKSARLQKVGYDTGLKTRRFAVGDLVVRYSTPQANEKILYDWDGPFTVVTVLSETTVVIMSTVGRKCKSHVARLRQWLGLPGDIHRLEESTKPTLASKPSCGKKRPANKGVAKKPRGRPRKLTKVDTPVATQCGERQKKVSKLPTQHPTGIRSGVRPVQRADPTKEKSRSESVTVLGPLRRSERIQNRVKFK